MTVYDTRLATLPQTNSVLRNKIKRTNIPLFVVKITAQKALEQLPPIVTQVYILWSLQQRKHRLHL